MDVFVTCPCDEATVSLMADLCLSSIGMFYRSILSLIMSIYQINDWRKEDVKTIKSIL